MAEDERNKLGEAVAGFATGVYDAPKTMLQNQALGLSMFGAGADFGEAIPELKEIIPVFAKLENTNPDTMKNLLLNILRGNLTGASLICSKYTK